MSQPASVTTRSTAHDIASRFVQAVAVRDFDGIETCFHPAVKFRGLTPPALREGTTAAEAAGWFRRWKSDATEYEMIASTIEPAIDKFHISYRIRLKENGNWYIVEQHIYCTITASQITTMDLLCSGFQPIEWQDG